jgi:uncharacterized protein (TIGR00730 family)
MTSICVYCGSSPGNDPVYLQKAGELGEALALKKLNLVYGGGKYGLMGKVADSALGQGGKALGVIPASLKDKELAHPGLTELYIVKDMHERKAKMAELADAFIALPGGFGTLEGVMEVITWNQLGFQSKPVGFLNVNGYFDGLFAFLRRTTSGGFVKEGLVDALVLESDPGLLVDKITGNPWPDLGQWPRKSQ